MKAKESLGSYSVIVVDVVLPGTMDGFDCTREIREFDDQTSIFIVSAVEDPEWALRARSVGANGFFVKPITSDAVSKMLTGREGVNLLEVSRKVSDPCLPEIQLASADEKKPSQDDLGRAVFAALWNEDEGAVRSLLKEVPSLLNWSDPLTGNTLLHLAARASNAAIMGLLLDLGANVNLCSQKGYNAMHVAAWIGSLACVMLLEERGCSVTQLVRSFRV